MFNKIVITLIFLTISSWTNLANANNEKIIKANDPANIKDCHEKLNRFTFAINKKLDDIIFEPVAKTYRVLPSPIRNGVSNSLNNLSNLVTIPNNILQGEFKKAGTNTSRFAINTTLGILGFIDVAEKIGLEEKEEDYGQTLATWGVGDGFYIVLPLFGPSNLRDTSGMVLTMLTDPINAYAVSEGEAWLVPMRTAVNAVDTRSQIIDEVNALRDNSVDYYAAVRSSYYQNRKAAINNVDDSELTPLPLISIEFE